LSLSLWERLGEGLSRPHQDLTRRRPSMGRRKVFKQARGPQKPPPLLHPQTNSLRYEIALDVTATRLHPSLSSVRGNRLVQNRRHRLQNKRVQGLRSVGKEECRSHGRSQQAQRIKQPVVVSTESGNDYRQSLPSTDRSSPHPRPFSQRKKGDE